MSARISNYYKEELIDWNNSIIFYNHEMDEFEHRLMEVISRNTVTGLAQKVEEQHKRLHAASHGFYGLQNEIQRQDMALKSGDTLKDDALLTEEIKSVQIELRRKMQAAEKQYIDTKFECYRFLSETLNNQKS